MNLVIFTATALFATLHVVLPVFEEALINGTFYSSAFGSSLWAENTHEANVARYTEISYFAVFATIFIAGSTDLYVLAKRKQFTKTIWETVSVLVAITHCSILFARYASATHASQEDHNVVRVTPWNVILTNLLIVCLFADIVYSQTSVNIRDTLMIRV